MATKLARDQKHVTPETANNLRQLYFWLLQEGYSEESAKGATIFALESTRHAGSMYNLRFPDMCAELLSNSRRVWEDGRYAGVYDRLVSNKLQGHEFSSGRWYVHRGNSIIGRNNAGDDACIVAHVFGSSKKERTANMALITAAPLLLAAVERALDECTIANHNGDSNATCNACDIYRIAVSAARTWCPPKE